MKKLFFLLLLATPFLSYTGSKNNLKIERIAARCTGSTPCSACSNCSSCKWCSSGGTCGVCAAPKKTAPAPVATQSQKKSTQSQPYSSQCRAITKKGTRCSRSARSNGYCWQHGG